MHIFLAGVEEITIIVNFMNVDLKLYQILEQC